MLNLRGLNFLRRRRIKPEIRNPEDILPFLRRKISGEREVFLVASLNEDDELIAVHVIAEGGKHRVRFDTRHIFRRAILDNASRIIVAHNHPSGKMTPSTSDRSVTKRLGFWGEGLGIDLIDHIIISDHRYFSFLEEGLI